MGYRLGLQAIGCAAMIAGCGQDAENGGAAGEEHVKLTVSCGSVGKDFELCKQGVEAWVARTGHRVEYMSTPTSATEMLALYQQLLAAGSTDVDVFQVDVIWPGIIGDFFFDLAPFARETDKFYPATIENDTSRGRLVAMPWTIDAGVLYYRKDLLEKYNEPVPETWEQLTGAAQRIQEAERKAGDAQMWGFVWQGRAYEGLTCNALEWVASHGGGEIVDPSGKVDIDNPAAAAAIQMAAGWIDTITPKGVLNYAEEESRGVFQSGNAVFMRNWPYAWALSQGEDSPVKGKVGVTRLPKGGTDGRHAAALGGWSLAVSKYSKHPEIAADLVMFLTSAEEQRRRAIEGSQAPTVSELYQDPKVLEANPFFAELHGTFLDAVHRPSTVTGAKYNQVSSEFWNAVHSTLSGDRKAEEGLKALDASLERMSNDGERW